MAISRVSSAIASGNTLTMPAHAPGDLLVAIVGRNNTTLPDEASGWLTKTTGSHSGASIRIAEKIATCNFESFGTWTNASIVAVVVYRSTTGKYLLLSGASAGGSTSSTLVNYSIIAAGVFSGLNNTYWVLGAAFIAATGTNADSDPDTGISLPNIVTLDNGTSEMTVKDSNTNRVNFATGSSFTASTAVNSRTACTTIQETTVDLPKSLGVNGGFQN